MTRWEYCEAVWQPDNVSLTMPVPDEETVPATYPAQQWPQVMAQLGVDGWELVGCTASPVGAHEYYFYFKRALED
jgi:predicted cupin superfamily sugar epimerase